MLTLAARKLRALRVRAGGHGRPTEAEVRAVECRFASRLPAREPILSGASHVEPSLVVE